MHIVTGELRKATYIKSGVGKDGGSTMFGIELSEMIKDYKTGEKTYTNYKAILFAASPAHINHYTNTLVEGNWVSLAAEKLKIEVSPCGQYTKLFMENARIDASGFIKQNNQAAPQQKQQAPQQQGAYQQPQQQSRPQQRPAQQQAAPQQQPMQGNPIAPQGNQQQPAQAPALDDGWDDDIPF